MSETAARPSDLATRPVETLIPYARNSRTHSDEQVAQIAASIREFGFTNPVLIDGQPGYKQSCDDIRAEIARLEGML